MPKFKDAEGREWRLHVDIPVARAVRRELDVDILDLEEGLDRFAKDPILAADVLFVLCRDQADRAGVTDEEFGRSLRGDAMGDACDAFLEALMDFFPIRQRETLAAMDKTCRDLETAMHQMATKKIPAAIETLLEIGGRSSPDTPESSGTSRPELCETSAAPSTSG